MYQPEIFIAERQIKKLSITVECYSLFMRDQKNDEG